MYDFYMVSLKLYRSDKVTIKLNYMKICVIYIYNVTYII